jgi:hypothetical protein
MDKPSGEVHESAFQPGDPCVVRPRIHVINAGGRSQGPLPEPACGCDSYTQVICEVHCVVGDVAVPVNGCGIYG